VDSNCNSRYVWLQLISNGTIPLQTISTSGTTQGYGYAITPEGSCAGTVTNYTVLDEIETNYCI
jgi:hypothetical protein